MKMSTRGRYGLRVMIELACAWGQGPTLVDTIAQNQEISANYLHLLLASLRTAGLVRATRGPKGGYELARAPGAITALDVVSALEGQISPSECVTDAPCCSRSNGCVAREVWCEVALAVERVLAERTLEQLASRHRALQEAPLSYTI